MEGFNKDTPLTKLVCRANALFTIPYLLSAFCFIFKNITDSAFREYQGIPSLFFIITYVSFIVFYGFLFLCLLRIRKWSRWLILVDSIAGLFLIFTFGFIGAYALGSHPSQFVYLTLIKLGEYVHSKILLWAAFSLKAIINTIEQIKISVASSVH
jgi:hypothetical protein